MDVLVTGATGLIGRRIVVDRLARGDRVTIVSRSPERAAALFAAASDPNIVIVRGDPSIPGDWQGEVDGMDAVVHLAGAPIAGKRWTRALKREIVQSRIDSTFQLVEAMSDARIKPRVLVAASAIGIYGDTGGRAVDETASPVSSDFLSKLVVEWEAVAKRAESIGIRVVHLRLGAVLDDRGGMVGALLRPFRMGLGGPVGSGRQYVSWIHWRDVVGLVDLSLRDGALAGPLNATSPDPVTNREFSHALAAAMGKPCWLPLPGFALRLAIGELAKYAVMSQRVLPARALDAGYRFRAPSIAPALESLFDGEVEDDLESVVVVDTPEDSTAMPAAPIRLLAVSADGALSRSDGQLPAGVVRALRAAQAADCVVTLATGRPPRAVAPLLQAIGTVGPLIAYGGAVIWNPVTATAQYHESLDGALASEVVARARRLVPEITIGIEILDRWFSDRADAAGLLPDEVGPLERFCREPVTQVNIFGDVNDIEAVQNALADDLWRDRMISVFRPAPSLLQVMHPVVDKAIALQRVAYHLGTSQEGVLAVGGSPLDAGMMNWAGFAVAVDDAAPAVREASDVIVRHDDDLGVVRAVHRYVLVDPNTIRTGAAGYNRTRPQSSGETA